MRPTERAFAILPMVPCSERKCEPDVARAERTLDRMRSNPRDWRIATLESVAGAHGLNIRKPGGSHVTFEHPAVAEALSVPRAGQSSRFTSVACRVYSGGASEQ
jgi:hypothetical protein